MKKYILSFGTKEYYGSLKLLGMSSIGMVDKAILCTESSLDQNFISANEKIFSQPRGFGYWLWKPYLINEMFKYAQHGDMIAYCDSASVITSPLNNLFEMCEKNDDILLFENMNGSYDKPWINKDWTKIDCFNLMNCRGEKYTDGKQVDAAFQVYKKTEKTVKFVNEYLEFCQDENILTDAPNITGQNFESFIDHRHDQSVLSLLAIKYGVNLESCPSQWRISNENEKFPISFFHHKQKLVDA